MCDDEPKKTVYTEIDREFKRMKPGTEFCRIKFILLKKMSKGEVKRIDKGKYIKL